MSTYGRWWSNHQDPTDPKNEETKVALFLFLHSIAPVHPL